MLWPTAAARSGFSRIALKIGADRRAHDAQRDHDADEVAEREERIERPAGGEVERREAEIEARRRHAGQAVLAAGPVRQRIELDEEEDLRDRHRDHREVDAGAAQRDQADQVADDRGRDHADDQRRAARAGSPARVSR